MAYYSDDIFDGYGEYDTYPESDYDDDDSWLDEDNDDSWITDEDEEGFVNLDDVDFERYDGSSDNW